MRKLQILIALLVHTGLAAAGNLEFKFIGNMAFRISDGKTALFSDFPYTSGSFGYMTYDLKDAAPTTNGVVLITHKHADHWNPKLFDSLNLAIIAPAEIQAQVKTGTKIPFSSQIRYKDLLIEPFRTPHTPEHHSYLVTWHGIRIYFPGDTDTLDQLIKMRNLDVAFISPWLLSALKEKGQTIDTEKLVVYHHAADEKIPEYADRIVPKQNETFSLPFADP